MTSITYSPVGESPYPPARPGAGHRDASFCSRFAGLTAFSDTGLVFRFLCTRRCALIWLVMLAGTASRAQNLPGLSFGTQAQYGIAPERNPLGDLRQEQAQEIERQNKQRIQRAIVEQNTRRADAEAELEALRAEEEVRQQATAPFLQAATQLLDMAEGRSRVQVKRAVFLVEDAFGRNRLDYQAYCAQIARRVAAMKRYAAWKGMD